MSAITVTTLILFVGSNLLLFAALVWWSRSEMRQSDRRRRDLQQRLADVLESATDAIITIDDAQRVQLFNRAAEEIFGRPASEVLGRPLDMLLPERYRDVHVDHIRQYASTRSTRRAMGRLGTLFGVRADGREFPIEASISQVESGGRKLLTVILRDITERVRTEESLKNHVSRVEALAELDRAILGVRSSSEIAQTALLHLRRLVPCNCASVAVFDSSSGEPRLLAAERAPGSCYAACAHPVAVYEQAQPGIGSSNQPILLGDLWAVETKADLFHALRQGGAISYAALPLHGEHRLLGMLELVDREVDAFTPAHVQTARTIADQLAIALQQAMLRDDIDRHAASLEQRVRERTEALEQANRRLTEVNRDLEDFTAYAAHDLRSPLNAMTSQCGLLRTLLPPADEETRQRMDRIELSVRRMNDVIDGMLGLAQLSKIELAQRRVDLDAMAADIIQELRQQYPSHPVRYKLQCGSPICADPRLMRSLLFNLLGNAWKYTTKTANPTVELARIGGEAVPTYFIRDNGAGFDMEYAQHLFEPFRRMHTATQFPGVGIGLATVARIIQRYGGTIRAESRVGSGTVFHFTLPKAEQKEAVSGWRLAVSQSQED